MKKLILSLAVLLATAGTADAATITGRAPISIQMGNSPVIQARYAEEAALIEAQRNACEKSGTGRIICMRHHFFVDTAADMVTCLLEYETR